MEESERDVEMDWIKVEDDLPQDKFEARIVFVKPIPKDLPSFYQLSTFNRGRGWSSIPDCCEVIAWCDFKEVPDDYIEKEEPKKAEVVYREIKEEKPKSWFFPWKN